MKKIFIDIMYCLVGGALIFTISGFAVADTSSTDFGSFSIGSINGQDGWGVTGSYDQGIVANTFGYGIFGVNSFRISNAVTSVSFADQIFSKSLVNEAGESSAQTSSFSGGTRQPYFEAQFDIASALPGTWQQGLNISVSPDAGNGTSQMSYLRFEDQIDGIHLFFDEYQDISPRGSFANPANGCSSRDGFVEIDAGTFNRSSPHTIKFSILFSDGQANDVVKIYVDGNLVRTATSWEDYYRWCTAAGGGAENNASIDVSRAVDSLLFRESGVAAPANSGKGFLIDNFSVLSGPDPAAPAPTPTPSPTPTPTPPPPSMANLHIIKLVFNNNSGASIASDFNVTVKLVGTNVTGSPAAGIASPGTLYTLAPGTYIVSENTNTSYTESFSGACNSSGSVTLIAGDDKTCSIISTDIPPPSQFSSFGGGSTFAPLPLISVTKIPSPLALPLGPGSVSYAYAASNIGEVALQGVWVRDDKCSPVNFISGDTNNDGMLDTNEIWLYQCVKTLSHTETNTATAHGSANGWDGYATSISTINVGEPAPPPLINIIKVPDSLIPLPFGGGDVTFTYVITNPGVTTMHDVLVSDDKCSNVSFLSGDTNNNSLLEPGEAWAYSCKTNVAVSSRNIATAEGKANGFVALAYAFVDTIVAPPGLPNTGITKTTTTTTTTTTTVSPGSLSIGSQGEAVTALQKALEKKGFLKMPAGESYGFFGALTADAVGKYQASVGLPSTGVFDLATKALLYADAVNNIALPKTGTEKIPVPANTNNLNSASWNWFVIFILLILIIFIVYEIIRKWKEDLKK